MFPYCNVVQNGKDGGVLILLPKYERIQQQIIQPMVLRSYYHKQQCSCTRCIQHWATYRQTLANRIALSLRKKTFSRYRRQSGMDSKLPPITTPDDSLSILSDASEMRRIFSASGSTRLSIDARDSFRSGSVDCDGLGSVNGEIEATSDGKGEMNGEGEQNEDELAAKNRAITSRRASLVRENRAGLSSQTHGNTSEPGTADERNRLRRRDSYTRARTASQNDADAAVQSEFNETIKMALELLGNEDSDAVDTLQDVIRSSRKKHYDKYWRIMKAFATLTNQLKRKQGNRQRRKLSLKRTIDLINVIKPLIGPRKWPGKGKHVLLITDPDSAGTDLEDIGEEGSEGAEEDTGENGEGDSKQDVENVEIFLRAITRNATRKAFKRLLKEQTKLPPTKEDCESSSDESLDFSFDNNEEFEDAGRELPSRQHAQSTPNRASHSALDTNSAPSASALGTATVATTGAAQSSSETDEEKRKNKLPARTETPTEEEPSWEEILKRLNGRQRMRLVSSIALDMKRHTANIAAIEKMKAMQRSRDVPEIRFDEFFNDPVFKFAHDQEYAGSSAVNGLSWNYLSSSNKTIRLYKGLPEWARRRFAPETGSRFTLPTDRRQLERMTPLDYLRQHCVVMKDRLLVYSKVYTAHRKYGETWLSFEGLNKALMNLYGITLKLADFEFVFKMLNINSSNAHQIDLETFAVISGFVERVFYKRLSRSVKFFKDEIEEADFYCFGMKMKDLKINDHLRQLFSILHN